MKMGQLRQEPQEPVITYLERALVIAKSVKLHEKHEIRALIEGLRPQIQTFVIQQKVASFDDLKEAAHLAEKSFRPMPSADDAISAIRRLEEVIKNNHIIPATAHSISPPTVTPLQTTGIGPSLQSTRPARTRYTCNQLSQQFQLQGAQQPQTAGNCQDRPPRISGEQQKCYRCFKNHHFKNCSFVNFRCFYCGVTGHIKAACRRRTSITDFTTIIQSHAEITKL